MYMHIYKCMYLYIKQHHQLECNCRIKSKCPLNGDCQKEDVMYKCTELKTFQPKKSVSWPC